MVSPELVKQLLKELEKEKGCPVQLRVETPGSDTSTEPCYPQVEYLGPFSERSLEVIRVDDLAEQYIPDVELIEGKYESFTDLQKKVVEYNVLWCYDTFNDSPAVRALRLVRNQVLIPSRSGCLGELIEIGDVQRIQVEEILKQNRITYFQNHIVADVTGIYHPSVFRTHMHIEAVNKTKIADVGIKLIE